MALATKRNTTSLAEVFATSVPPHIASSIFGAAHNLHNIVFTVRHSDRPASQRVVSVPLAGIPDVCISCVENLALESLQGLPGDFVARLRLEEVRLQRVVVAD